MAVQKANYIHRDFEVDGVSATGFHKVVPAEERVWGTWVENAINAGLSNGGLIYDTKASMNADLAHPANASAWVVSDGANNGIYRKSGASGAGSWTKIADLPYSVVYAQNDGSGTANAVVATSSVPVSTAAYSQLISVPFTATNTGAMTIAINGEAPRALVLNVGSPIPAGYVSAGMSALVQIDSAGNYRLFSYGDASAIQAAAEALLALFNTQYLGAYATNPSTDPAGGALQQGAFYWNTASEVHRYWDGDSWETFPFATVADEAVTEQKLAGKAVSESKLSNNIVSRLNSANSRATRQRVFDFHFGCARGCGFNAASDGGVIEYTLASPAAAGDTSFSYTGTAPGADTLMVVLGTDGKYYTVTVGTASGGTCSLYSPLPVDVAAGQNAWSFWLDFAHPNAKAAKAYADYALREDFAVWQKVYQRRPFALGGAAIDVWAANSGFNPGSATSLNGWTVTPAAAGDGCRWYWRPKRTGIYRAVFEISKNDTSSTDIDFKVIQSGQIIAAYTVVTSDCVRHQVDFAVTSRKAVTFTATRDATLFVASQIAIYEQVDGPMLDLNWGTHVMLGDSWVGIVQPEFAARLDKATVIHAGVGGNTSAQALARFDTDVTPHSPNFVWILVGTNDITSAIDPEIFSINLGLICARCQAIGAIPIVITPFCGASDHTDWIDTARNYYVKAAYWETDLPESVRYDINVPVAGSTAAPILSLGIQSGMFDVVSSYLSATVAIKENSSQPTTGGTQIGAVTAGFEDAPTVVVPGGGKFVQFIRTNTGADEVVSGYVELLFP